MTSSVIVTFCWMAVLFYKRRWWRSISIHSLWSPLRPSCGSPNFSSCQDAHICKLYGPLLKPSSSSLTAMSAVLHVREARHCKTALLLWSCAFSFCLQRMQWLQTDKWNVRKVLKGWISHTVKVSYEICRKMFSILWYDLSHRIL